MRKTTMLIAVGLVLALLVGTALAKQKFYGTVKSMPASGLLGEWVIDGKTVNVVKDTELDQEHGPFAVGSYVKVEGVEFEGKFIATEVETKRGK
jgi:hypothetical protein